MADTAVSSLHLRENSRTLETALLVFPSRWLSRGSSKVYWPAYISTVFGTCSAAADGPIPWEMRGWCQSTGSTG